MDETMASDEAEVNSFHNFLKIYPENLDMLDALAESVAGFFKAHNLRPSRRSEGFIQQMLMLDESPVDAINEQYADVTGTRGYFDEYKFLKEEAERAGHEDDIEPPEAFLLNESSVEADRSIDKMRAMGDGFNDRIYLMLLDYLAGHSLYVTEDGAAQSHLFVMGTIVKDATEFTMLNPDCLNQAQYDSEAKEFGLEKDELTAEERYVGLVTSMTQMVAFAITDLVMQSPVFRPAPGRSPQP